MTIFEECSPNGNVWAVLEQESDTCYFYLHPEPETPLKLKSCWVRNLAPAPERLDVCSMREGKPPMLPKEYCRHPEGVLPFESGDLSVIWSEDGSSAALCERGELLAIIPWRSGSDGFHGFARDCIGRSPLCWGLDDESAKSEVDRYIAARASWGEWSVGDGPWAAFQAAMIDALEREAGRHTNYYAIDGGNWPPRALLRMPWLTHVLLATVGMALRPQPGLEAHFQDTQPYRRIELAAVIDPTHSEEDIRKVASYISGQVQLPWARHTFLWHGHTLPSDAFSDISGGKFAFVLLEAHPPQPPKISLPRFRNDPITLLWMCPISHGERQFAQQNGSAQLSLRLSELAGNDKYSLARREVV